MSDFFPAEVWPYARKSKSIFQYIPYQRIGLFTAISEFALIVAASVATGIVYHSIVFENEGDIAAYFAVGTYSGLIFVLLSRLLGLYQPNTLLSASTQIRGIFVAWGAVLLFVTSVFFLLKSGASYSRGATISFGCIGFGLVLASRAVTAINLKQALADGTLAGQRVIVIGDPEELSAKPALELLRTYGTREVGRFELSLGSDRGKSGIAQEMSIVDSAVKAAQTENAEQVLLAMRWVDVWRRELICERLRTLPLPVLLLPDRSVSTVFTETDNYLCSLAAIEVQRAPLSNQDLFVKRFVDVILAGIGLVLLSPLLLVTTIAIKLDSSGPIMFRQRRKGFSGREFVIYKFRTMSVQEDGQYIRQAQRNDERVTRLGRLLRASSIDELPQLVNVLAGNMSLVGPRPHAIAHDDQYANSIDNYAFRHHVKPGITGWAQTHGFRGETADVGMMKKRIQLDLWYINNWNLWLDFRILAKTCLELLRPRNVY
jgi:Undecaprenyl-phosphate glucose phosphotransferase